LGGLTSRLLSELGNLDTGVAGGRDLAGEVELADGDEPHELQLNEAVVVPRGRRGALEAGTGRQAPAPAGQLDAADLDLDAPRDVLDRVRAVPAPDVVRREHDRRPEDGLEVV